VYPDSLFKFQSIVCKIRAIELIFTFHRWS
jgi:hypothetical protein